MSPDWRELYESNQAAIRRAGVPAAVLSGPAAPSARAELTVHVPRGLPVGQAVPLVCMLHGCTQDAATFAAATRMNAAADRHGFVVAYPQQSRRRNPQGCWNWFAPEHQARGRGEPAAIVRALEADPDGALIDRRRVFVAGISAGAAMATILAATYPDVFAAVATHSGLAFRAAGDLSSAWQAMSHGAPEERLQELERPVPNMVIHGDSDRIVAPRNGEQTLRQALITSRRAAPELCDFDPERPSRTTAGRAPGGLSFVSSQWNDTSGRLWHESLVVAGLGHAWSGGTRGGSFTDPRGPDATEAIWRFFAQADVTRT